MVYFVIALMLAFYLSRQRFNCSHPRNLCVFKKHVTFFMRHSNIIQLYQKYQNI